MHILLVSATAKEIKPFLEKLRKEPSFPGENSMLDILITGIGLTATTYALTKQLNTRRPDTVIQAGVAGAMDHSFKLGTVVAVKAEALADQSVIELKKLRTLFDLKLVPQDQHPFRKGWLVNPHKELLKNCGLRLVKGISVNEITTSPQRIKYYAESFNATVESMEGAAFHYVCLMEKVPFIQIRSISNYIGERNKTKWNMTDSIDNLNKELLRVISRIISYK